MSGLRRILEIIREALREIFDESAYARFLVEHRIAAGRDSYAAFMREHEAAKARRPKCC